MADLAPQISAPSTRTRDNSEASLTLSPDFADPGARRNSSIDTPVAWAPAHFTPGEPPENQNGHLTPTQHNAPSRSGSDGGGSRTGKTPSTIHDLGDGELLKREIELLSREKHESREDNGASSSPSQSPTHNRSPSESRQSTAELTAHSDAFPKVSAPPEPEVSDDELAPEFETAIRAGFQESASKAKGNYLPIDDFNRIVTRDRVRQELSLLGPRSIPPSKLEWYTDQVWDPAPPAKARSHESTRPTTRRKIFAILALIQRVKDIVRFIDANLHDNDLPFLLSDGRRPGTRQLQRKGRDGNLYPITIVSDWPTCLLELFNSYQWNLLPPYFTLSTRTTPEVLHYSLEDGIVLPFIEDEEIASGNSGGYGDVWRVKIHPAHHNCSHDGPSNQVNPDYAIKRLRHRNREAFKKEVSNLKRFSSRDHVHLIKLLVTFEWRQDFYLLFPCADGNLLDFWKRYRSVEEIPRDHKFAVWFSGQCLGLAEGLKMIHTVEFKRGEFLGIPAHEQEKTHGRHGDLKPENILWFRPVGAYRPHETDEGSDMGVLKISDFGLSKFHRTGSLLSGQQRENGKSTAVSPTYRAPEYDIANGLDQSYDIWTLGCVLLEFVAWYVLGWDEVEKFSRRRVDDDYREIKEDVFFNNVEIIPEDGDKKNAEMGAQAKRAVYKEFQELYQHPRCSDLISDLLFFIENDLLRMGPSKRAKCEAIVERLAALHERCKTDSSYSTKRMKSEFPRARTDLSLLAASAIPYSEGMKKRIRRSPVPEVRENNFPSLASQIAEGFTEGFNKFNNFIDSHRSDDNNGTRESSSSRRAAQVVPTVMITQHTPPPRIESGTTNGVPGAHSDDAQSEPLKDSTRQDNQEAGTNTPSEGPHQPQQTLQPALVNTDGDSTDQDSQRKPEDEPSSLENDTNGFEVTTSRPVPQGPAPEPKGGGTPGRGLWGRIFCGWLPSRQKVSSTYGSHHKVETITASK